MAARSSKADQAAVDPALPFKRRARRRLVGAVIVAVAVAVGLPFVLDPEPAFERPDIRLDVPSRETPLPVSVAPVPTPAPAAVAPQTPVPANAATATQSSTPVAMAGGARPAASAPAPGGAAPPPSPATSPPSARPATPPSAAAATPAPSANAAPSRPPPAPQAGNDRPPAPTASAATGRWVIQAGLFARPENATALAGRIKGMGLPAYTESIDAGQGVRVRVRVGPFASRTEADQARARLSLNGIDSSLVSP